MTQPVSGPPASGGPSNTSPVSGNPSGSVALGTARQYAQFRRAARGRPRGVGIRAIVSRLGWAVALATLSAAVTGVAASASPATALRAPHAAMALRAEGAPSGWVTTTDPVSGISVMLPGRPTVKNTTATIVGKSITSRTYSQEHSGAKGVIVFKVADVASGADDLDAAIQGTASTPEWSNGTVTSSRHFVLDGHPALDGRFTATINNRPIIGLVRFVSGSDYSVGILTVGVVTDENTLAQSHQQVLGTLQLPAPSR
jgi:hypothetical protein